MFRTCDVRLPAIAFTLSVRSFQVPATPGTKACPPSRPSVPTSRATRVTSAANERSCSTIVFRVSLSSRISPRTSTVIFLDRSPPAMAVATSAMLRTCAVRLEAMKLTLSVKSFHVPALGADFARHARHLGGERTQLLHHRVQGVLQQKDLAAHVDRDFFGQVAAGNRGGDLGDVADLGGQIAGHRVDAVGQIFPGAG